MLPLFPTAGELAAVASLVRPPNFTRLCPGRRTHWKRKTRRFTSHAKGGR
jgi:hypothetical protein